MSKPLLTCARRARLNGARSDTATPFLLNGLEVFRFQFAHRVDAGTGAGAHSLARIGDCEAPAIIAGAVFSGHRYARELDTMVNPDNRIKYDRVFFEDG